MRNVRATGAAAASEEEQAVEARVKEGVRVGIPERGSAMKPAALFSLTDTSIVCVALVALAFLPHREQGCSQREAVHLLS